MDIGAIALAFAAIVFIGWLGFLVTGSRVRHRRERPPENQSPYVTDDELETRKLDRVLLAALISSVILAIVLPIYFLNETERQEAAAHRFDEIAVERGHHWWDEFACASCHGADGGGGGAPFIEPNSGIPVTWSAPSLNDIFYRYSVEEARFWIVFGRQGTPMPAWGVEGGGPLSEQQVDELVAYIQSIQVPQSEAVATVEGRVDRELSTLEAADDRVADAVAAQEAEIAALAAVEGQYEQLGRISEELADILTDDSTCSDESAAAVATFCDARNADTDRDGISDNAEAELNRLVERVLTIAPDSDAKSKVTVVSFDAANAFTTSTGSGDPIPDVDQLEVLVTEFSTIARDLRLTLENMETIAAATEAGLAALLDAQQARRWAFDVEAIAAQAFEGNIADTHRAIGLYNAYCARCHTAGYSAGVTFTNEPGSGALGPSLREGRSVVQFPDEDDHYSFVVNGSASAQQYGVSGIGKGWMPGFGALLSAEDIRLIVKLERALR